MKGVESIARKLTCFLRLPRKDGGRKIYVVPQQHWDPWWTIGPKLSEQMGVRNVRKALDIMREIPEFTYVVAQVYLWELFQKHFPERIEEFRQRVREGRMILACGGYVNPDFNLPSGESLIRQLTFAQKTWGEEFGITPEVVWIQDSFGQSAQLPQIFTKLGLQYHTAKRGAWKDLPAVFIWEGVDGSQIIFDRQPLGHHGIVFSPPYSCIPNREHPWENLEKILKPLSFPFALIALYLPDFYIWASTKGRVRSFREALDFLDRLYPGREIFIPHGFAGDGVMPVGWIAYLCKTYTRLSNDEMFLTTPLTFFEQMEKYRGELTVIRGELNGPTEKAGEAFGALPGTYSTRIRTKQRARRMERSLYLAELLETLKALTGEAYQDLTGIWKLKFLTDFHDGICGSLNDKNYKILRRKAYRVLSSCRKIIEEGLEVLAPPEGILNPLPWPRREIVEYKGKEVLVEASGLGIYPVKVIDSVDEGRFVVGPKSLSTPFYRVSWEDNALKIFRLAPQGVADKRISGEHFAEFRIQDENGDTYFWDVSGEEWARVVVIRLKSVDRCRAVLELTSTVRSLLIVQEICFYAHTPRIDFQVRLVNREKNIRLQAHLSWKKDTPEVIREIPAGFLEEGESPGQARWGEVFGPKYAYYDRTRCVQNWIWFGLGNEGIALFNDGLPEHEIMENSCFITLLRCVGRVGTEGKGLRKFHPIGVPSRAGGPHPVPLAQEQGKHEFRYAFYPCRRENAARAAYEFLFPLTLCNGKGDKGGISLFSVTHGNIIPLAIKKVDKEEGVVVRLLETEGKHQLAILSLNPSLELKSAKLLDLVEEEVSDLEIEGDILKLRFKPQEIITLLLER